MNQHPMPHRILVVDDESDVVLIIKTTLQAEGYDVASATNGKDALEEAFETRPDLIVLDVMMPGMTGFDVLKELKANESTATVPVVMLTGVSDKKKIQEALESGIDYYVVKPFDFDDLLGKIKHALEGFDA
jgi:two-component system sensor histidine kinase/response regulator